MIQPVLGAHGIIAGQAEHLKHLHLESGGGLGVEYQGLQRKISHKSDA